MVGPSAAAGRAALSWNSPDSDSGIANQEILALFRIESDSGDFPHLILRGSGAATTENGYLFAINAGRTTHSIGKYVAGLYVPLATMTKTIAAGAWVWARFRADGSAISLKIWNDGIAEPVAFDLAVTDSSHATGWLGVAAAYSAEIKHFSFFSVACASLAARGPEALAPALDQWCLLPDVISEITLGFERADSAGVVTKKWYTTRGPRHCGPSDYPANVEMESLVVDAGGFGQQLQADALFAAQALNSIQEVQLRNLPSIARGPGPIDDWDGYTFAGRPLEIRIGDANRPHRAFELLATPTVQGEPEVTPEEARVSLSPETSLLQQDLRVRTYLGIPTGIALLTLTGVASAPHHASYNILSFVACGRFRTTGINNGGGSGTGLIAGRTVSATNTQFKVEMNWLGHASAAGKLIASTSVAGVALTVGTTSARYDDGADHWWAFGVLDRVRLYFMVDGEILFAQAMTQSVDLPTATWRWGVSCKDGLFFDHRMSTWLTEDEVRAAMAARLPSTIPTNWIGVWPGDDASGGTATDYSALANHAALAGTINVDYRWDPTDLGMPEQAGRPMPLALGVLFNGKAEMCDSLRGRFRVNDGAITTGTALTVKARGLPITLTTDYTLPAPGVVDMVTAQSEPVTVDLSPAASPEDAAIHFPQVIADALTARHVAGTVSGMDGPSFSALRRRLPYRGGGAFSEALSGEALLNFLGPLGAHYFLDRSGRIAGGYLAPPVNPGPYGYSPLLEFLGFENCGVTIPPASSYSLMQSNSLRVTAWIKSPLLAYTDRSISSTFTFVPNGMTIVDRVGAGNAGGYYLGIDGRNNQVIFGIPGVVDTGTGKNYTAVSYPWDPTAWHLVSGRWHSTLGWKVEVRREGDPPSDGSFFGHPTTGAPIDVPSEPIRIGHGSRGSFVGAICYASGSSAAIPDSALDTMISTQPSIDAARDRWWVPLRDGEGDQCAEMVTGALGRIEGARWCPRLTLDFRTAVLPEFGGSLRLRPAWRASARFRNNSRPVTGADVASSVTGAQRVGLEAPWLDVPVEAGSVRDVYRDARELLLETLLDDRAHASAVARDVRSRFDPARRAADARKWRKSALRLQLTDEVLLYHDRFGLEAGKSCRVVSLASVLGDEILTDISTWR